MWNDSLCPLDEENADAAGLIAERQPRLHSDMVEQEVRLSGAFVAEGVVPLDIVLRHILDLVDYSPLDAPGNPAQKLVEIRASGPSDLQCGFRAQPPGLTYLPKVL